MKFAENLKKLRTKKNLTQDQLATELRYKKSTISMYELGNREPDLRTLVTIANYFNVSTDEILGVRGSDVIDNRLMYARIDRRLSEKQIAEYLGVTTEQYIEYEDNYAPREVIYRLSKYFNVDYRFLSGFRYKLSFPVKLWTRAQQEDYNDGSEYVRVMMEYRLGNIEYIDFDKSSHLSLPFQNNYNEKETRVISAYRSHPEMQPAIDKLLGIDSPSAGNIAADVAEETKDFIASRQSIGTK